MKSTMNMVSLLGGIIGNEAMVPHRRCRSAVKHSTPPEVVAFLKERAQAKRIRKANRGPGFSRKGMTHV